MLELKLILSTLLLMNFNPVNKLAIQWLQIFITVKKEKKKKGKTCLKNSRMHAKYSATKYQANIDSFISLLLFVLLTVIKFESCHSK